MTPTQKLEAVESAIAGSCAGPAPLFAKDDLVLVACSGGADSVALSSALALWAQASNCFPVALAHVDHGLRARSAAEAEGVRRLALRLGVPFFLRRLTGLADQLAVQGLEAAAREARYAALAAIAREAGAHAVATAHTRSDQAETLLLRLCRGAGPGALSGIRKVRTIGQLRVVRPLLEVPRAATEDYCARHGLSFTRDPHNLDPRRARTRVREALPQLASLLNPRLEEALAGTAALLADEDELLSALAAERLAAARVGAALSAPALCALPAPLLRRCLLAAAAEACVRPERTHLERVGALLRQGSGAVDLPLGRAVVEGGLLRFTSSRGRPASPGERKSAPRAPAGAQPGAAALPAVAVPGPGRYGWGTAMIEVTASGGEPVSGPGAVAPQPATLRIDAARAPFPWLLRTARTGERFRPGGGREKKVSDQLIDARVPRSLRPALAVLEDARGTLFFVEGLRPGEAARGALRHAISLRVSRCRRELDGSTEGLNP